MKHFVLFCLFATSFYSYPMLLLESAEQNGKRNAREVEAACIDCLNFVQKRFPEANPKDVNIIVLHIGQSQMTHEQKKEAFSRLEQTKTDVERRYQEDKKRKKEDHWILAQFDMVDNEEPVFKKIRRMG